MHELGIAESILEAVRTKRRLRIRPRAPVKVGVRMGALAGIDPDSLSFCFEALVKGSDLEPLALAIEPGAADQLEFAWLELDEP